MDLSAPLTAPLLLNAVESAYDTLRSQVLRVIDEASDTEDLTIDKIAARLGLCLDDFHGTMAARGFFVEAVESALADAGYSVVKPKARRKARRG